MASQKENHKTLEEWAGSKHLILTLVFADIVGSTEIGNSLGDTKWIKDLFVHFKRARSSVGYKRTSRAFAAHKSFGQL